MNYYMLIIDSIVIVVLTNFLALTYKFLRQAKANRDRHADDYVASMHFAEHAIAAYFAMLGSAIGVVTAVAHVFFQDVLQATIPAWIEYSASAAVVFLVASGWLFMHHMSKEETPGHPFYIREYGDDDDAKIQ